MGGMWAALASEHGISKVQGDPFLALAALLLIAVSTMWVVIWWRAVKEIRYRGLRLRKRPPRDIWKEPP